MAQRHPAPGVTRRGPGRIRTRVQDADTLLYVGCSRPRNYLVIPGDESLSDEIRSRLPAGCR